MKGEAMRKVSVILVIGLLVLSLFSGAVSGDIAVPSLRGAYTNVTADEAKGMIEANPNIILLDIRTLDDFSSGHISGARCVPLSELKERIEELDKDMDLIVYCNSGTKSKPACEILAENGFKNVYNMLGGIKAWTAAGFAVTTPSLPSYTSSEKNSVYSMIDSALDSNKSAFLFFYADWCHFSQQQEPILDELEREYAEKIAFFPVNAEENPQAMNEFGVMGFPAMFLVVDKNEEGYVYQEFSGFTEKEALEESFDYVVGNGKLPESFGSSSFYSNQTEIGNPLIISQNGKSGNYTHHSCSSWKCYEHCILEEFEEFELGAPEFQSITENIFDMMRDCLCPAGPACKASEDFEDAYRTYKRTKCAVKCNRAENSDDPRVIGECVRCIIAQVGGYIPGGSCVVGLTDFLGDLLVPHSDCIAECAAPPGTWESARGHPCHITNDIRYSCETPSHMARYWCEDCEWVFDDLVTDCDCRMTSSGAECRDEDDDDDDGDARRRPGGDMPDDRYDVSSLNVQGNQVQVNDRPPDIAILEHGFPSSIMNVLADLNESATLVSIGFLDIIKAEDFPVFIIPAGGLYGLDSSPTFKSWLERYVSSGGTLIVFSQQHGYEYLALPGNLSGYGWLEDQSCHYASAGISTYHPIFSGQVSAILNVSVDGFFTSYPPNSTILLSRTKNGMPAMLMYEYGKGTVIATTLYSDMAPLIYQGIEDEIILIRDIVAWAGADEIPSYAPGSVNISINVTNHYLSPLEYPVLEFDSGETVNMTINVTNSGNISSYKVSFVLFDPFFNKSWVNVSETILANQSRFINLTYPTTNSSKSGIWSIIYLLFAGNDTVSAGWGGEFALNYNITNLSQYEAFVTVFDPYKNIVKEEGNISLFILPGETGSINLTINSTQSGIWSIEYSVLSDENNVMISEVERFAVSKYAENLNGFVYHGERINFAVTAPEEHFACGSDIPFTTHIYNKEDFARNISCFDFCIQCCGKFPLWNEIITVPAQGESSFVHIVENVKYRRYYVTFHEDGSLIGRTEKLVRLFVPSVNVHVETDQKEYAKGEDVSVLLNLNNTQSISHNTTVILRTLDPANNKIYEASFDMNLSVYASENKTLDFTLPIDSEYGIYIVIAEAYEKGNKIGSASTYFKVLKDYFVDIGFDEPDRIYRVRQNMTVYMNATNHGASSWNSMLNISIPSLGFNDTKSVTVNPDETESISYHLSIPENITTGKHDVIVTISYDNTTEQDCFFIPESKLQHNLERMDYSAGENVSIKFENTGGVDTTYTYSAIPQDPYLATVFEDSKSGVIDAGETIIFNYSIPSGAINGTYFLKLEYENPRTNETSSSIEMLSVSGLNALLTSKTDKKVYSAEEDITVLTNITNLDGEIKNATLNLKVLSSKPPLPPKPCVIPTDNLYINSDTTLCPGIYNITDSGSNGVIIINASGVVVEGNDTVIVGAGSGYGIYNPGFDNVTIRNIEVKNYDIGIYLHSSSNNSITNNTANSNNEYGILLFDSSNNNTLTNNTASNNDYGIYLHSSSYNNISNNIIDGSSMTGFFILSNSYSNSIVNNKVNGDYYYHYVNARDLVIEDLILNAPDVSNLGKVSLINCTNVTLRNLTLANNYKYGVYMYKSNNITVENNNVSSNDCGIYLESNTYWSTIANNTANSNNYHGIHLYYSSNNTITNNTANSNNYHGIYLHPSSNNIITNNTANSNSYCGIYLHSSSNNTATNNTASNNDHGIYLALSGNNTATNNTASNNNYGIYLALSGNNTATNNTASNNNYGIYLHSSSNNTITNNTASNNNHGIYLYYSSYNNISNNIIDGSSMTGFFIPANSYSNSIVSNKVNGDYYYHYVDARDLIIEDLILNAPDVSNLGKVSLINCTNVTLRNLTLANNHKYGVYVYKSNDITIENNNVSSNDRYGIYLESNAYRNTIANNTASNNYHGIHLYYSSNNTITNNNASNNYHGIYLHSSSNSTITNNTASNNWYGIYIDRSTNNVLSANILCSNTRYDIYNLTAGNSGDNNTCNTTNNWNDEGTTGCTYLCTGISKSSTSSFVSTKHISSNRPPVPGFIPDVTVNEIDLVVVSPTATDPGNDTLVFTFTPPLNNSGMWQTTYGDAGIYTTTPTEMPNATQTEVPADIPTEAPIEVQTTPTPTPTITNNNAVNISLGLISSIKESITLGISQILTPVWAAEGDDSSRPFFSSSSNSNNESHTIWEQNLTINVTDFANITTNVGELNVTGKLYLYATLYSSTGQIIAYDISTFYITDKDLSLTMETDKRVYKPNETINIYGEVRNHGSTAESCNLSIKKDGDEIFSDAFTLNPDETHEFATSTSSNTSFTLEGVVEDVTITDFVSVESPSINVSVIAPDVVGLNPFDVGVLIENTGNISADLNVRINSTWNITIPEGESRLLETTMSTKKNITLNATISGDVNRTIQKGIICGENARINITPQPTYLEGTVEIPYLIENIGLLDSKFNATFSIDAQTIPENFFVPKGENITGSVSFNLTKGAHLLRYVSPFEIVNVTINVLSPPEFVVTSIYPEDMNFTLGENVILVFETKNTGGTEGEVTLKLSMPDFEDTNRTWIRPGEKENISFNLTIPDDLEEKNYKGIYELNGKRSEFRFFVQGANISVDASLDKPLYEEGETAILTLNVDNKCNMDLSLYSRVKFNEYDSVQNFTLPGLGSKTLTFYVPVNFTGDNKMLYTVYMDTGRSLYINSMYVYEKMPDVHMRLYTDKDVYNMGESVTIHIVDVTKTDVLNLTAPNFTYKDTLSGPAMLEFTLPELRSGTYYIEYTYGNFSSAHPFDVRGYSARIIEAGLDKEVYYTGDIIKLKMNIEANRDVSGLQKTWIYDPENELVDEFAMNKTLMEGENKIEISRTLSTNISGIHVIVYGFSAELSGDSLTMLVSGAEYFDGFSLDTEAPVISNVRTTELTAGSATIKWDTDEVSDSLVKYGTESGTYIMQEYDSAIVTYHSITLTGLSAGTIYYYVVKSTDISGNTNESVEYNFSTVVTPTPTPTPTPIPTTVNETEYLNSISQPIDISKIRFVLNAVNEEWVKGSKWSGRPMELMYWQKSTKYLIEIDIDENGYVTRVGFRRWGKPVTKIPYDLAVRSLDKL